MMKIHLSRMFMLSASHRALYVILCCSHETTLDKWCARRLALGLDQTSYNRVTASPEQWTHFYPRPERRIPNRVFINIIRSSTGHKLGMRLDCVRVSHLIIYFLT